MPRLGGCDRLHRRSPVLMRLWVAPGGASPVRRAGASHVTRVFGAEDELGKPGDRTRLRHQHRWTPGL